MVEINIKRLKDAMPENGTIQVGFKPSPKGKIPYLECKIEWPSLSKRFPKTYEKIYDEILDWQREIIGRENISEFYTETTGHHWFVYLKRVPVTFKID